VKHEKLKKYLKNKNITTFVLLKCVLAFIVGPCLELTRRVDAKKLSHSRKEGTRRKRQRDRKRGRRDSEEVRDFNTEYIRVTSFLSSRPN
jgi:hypothetical protein